MVPDEEEEVMMKLVMIALVIGLLAGCAIVPLESYHHHDHYQSSGYYQGRGYYDGRGYDERRYGGPYYRGYGYGYDRGR
jgi:hypothetical protein